MSGRAVCFVAMCAFAALAAGPRQATYETLVGLEHRWLDNEANPAELQAILAADFVHVLPVGFITKDEQLAYQRAHPRPRPAAKHFEDLRVRIFGNVGIVNGIVVATDPDGTTHKTYFTDVFAYRDHRWAAINAQETPGSSR